MSSRRNFRLQALTLAGILIPLGGDNEMARITLGAQHEVTRGVSTTVYNRIGQPDATLTLVFLPEDDGYRELRALILARQALPIATPMPGSAINASTGEICTWGDSEFVDLPDFLLSQTTAALQCTISLSNVVVTPPVVS